MQVAALFDNDAAQRPRGVRVFGQPVVRPDDDRVCVRSAAVQVLLLQLPAAGALYVGTDEGVARIPLHASERMETE